VQRHQQHHGGVHQRPQPTTKKLISLSGGPGGPVAKAPNYKSPVKKPPGPPLPSPSQSFSRTFFRKSYIKHKIAEREKELAARMPVTFKKIKTKHVPDTSPRVGIASSSSPLAKKEPKSPPSSPLTMVKPELPVVERKELGSTTVKVWTALPPRVRKFSNQQGVFIFALSFSKNNR
jgi:hypothetical protein